MSKPTNESVAKAAGWTWDINSSNEGEWTNGVGEYQPYLPPFTTSVDAMITLIEGEGLGWSVMLSDAERNEYTAHVESKLIGGPRSQYIDANDPALALATAYEAFKRKEKKT